jgi:benzoate membrane transport protein
MQRQRAVSGVTYPGFDGFELSVLEQLVCTPSKKWHETTIHFNSINRIPHAVNRFFGSAIKIMSSAHTPSSLHWSDLVHPVVAGLISVIVNYGGTFILVFQAARVAGLSPELTASWVWSISIGVGVTGLLLSWMTREPIITAWSTPAAAFLVTALATTPYAEAVGAYLVSATAFVVLGLSGYFERVIRLIPPGVAAGLLAGILLQFGIRAFGGMSVDPALAGLLIVAYVVLKRFLARYAVVGILVLGLAFLLLQNQVALSGLELKFAVPVFTKPEFSLNALLSVALPMFLITLTGQYMPGMLVLRNDGFRSSANPVVMVTGLGSLLMAPFGSHAFNIAAITAAIATGPEAHEDPSKRWIAGVAAGVCYILVGVFGVTLAAVFMAFPATFITTLAGLALLGTIGGSLATALADAKAREAALITFLAAAANITLWGIGGAFWGLIIGLLAYAVLNGRMPLRVESGSALSIKKG